MYFMDVLLFPVYKLYMYSQYYIPCLYHNILIKFVSLHSGQIDFLNDTKHEWVCLSISEKKDHATFFPNDPRIILKHLNQQQEEINRTN